MFGVKTLDFRSIKTMRNKEIKDLREMLVNQFPSLSSGDVLAVFPNKCEVQEIKLVDRTVLYVLDNVVYLIDHHGRNDLYPSLPFLWKLPHCLRQIVVHNPVSRFLLKGANLMAPGLAFLDGLESLKSNEKIAIRTKGNPMPFVVALCRMSYEAILVNRMKGQISETMHFFGDILSHKLVIEKHITRGSLLCPNSGFNGNSLVIGSILGNSDDSEDENDDEIVEDDACLSDPETTSQSNEDDMQHVSIEMKNSLVLNSDTKALENKFSDLCENESNMLSSVDDIILRSIFLTFKYLINPNSLPILFSQFWMYAQRCAQSDSLCSRSLVRFSQSREDRSSDSNPDNHSEKHMEGEDVLPVVDIKMSSFKKVSTLMMYLKELQVLTISSEGDKISSFNASHSSLASLKIDDVEGFRNRFFDILSHDNSIGMGSLTLSTLKMASQYAKQHAWSDNESIFRQIQINKVYSLPSNYNFMYPSVEEWNDDPSFENMKYAAVHHSKLLFTASQLKEVISHYLHHAQTSSSNLASNSSAASLSPAITPTCRCASIVEQPSDKSKLRIFPEDPFYRIVRKFLATENNRKASKNKADKSQRPTNISQIEESERHQDDLDGGFTPLPPPEVESSSSYQCVGGVMLSSLKQSNQWREQQDQEEQRRKDIILASASNSSQLPSTKKEWKPYVLSSSSSSSSSSSFSSSANAATAWPSLSTAKSREPLDAECRKTGARTVTTTAWKESTTSQSSAKNKTNTSICCSNNGNDSLPENDYLEVSKNFLYQEIQGSCTTYYLVASNGIERVLSSSPMIHIATKIYSKNRRMKFVGGMDSLGYNLKELAEVMKIKFSTSVSVKASEQTSALDVLNIMGDIDVKSFLVKECGIPVSLIKETDGKL